MSGVDVADLYDQERDQEAGRQQLARSSERGEWGCLTCAGAILYSALSQAWAHYDPDLQATCRQLLPSHDPDPRAIERGKWPIPAEAASAATIPCSSCGAAEHTATDHWTLLNGGSFNDQPH